MKSKQQGLLIVISAPSGAGKGTIINKMLEKNNNLWLSVSETSRPMRANDIDGITYHFCTKEEFEEKIKDDYFLEYALYANNYYGTPKKYIQEHLSKGQDVILEIEIQGAMQIKKLIPEALFIFIMPPSLNELKKRLVGRGTDTKEKILERFKIAYQEMNDVTKYNYVVVNDEIDVAADKILSIIKAERCRVDRIEDVFLNTEEEYMHEMLVDKDLDNNPLEIN
ncbi:MAG TPA: guanylate kinase [Candidatus Faecisoma merdavium]|nr:guanylate kinase [Candidatus Faecisoma merdavium]